MKVVKEDKSWLEWLVFTVSCVLIVVVVGYLILDASRDQGRPPDIRVSVGQAVVSNHGYVVPVKVTNQGDQTAQAVELEIVSPGPPEQQASLSYDFLSSGEIRQGWVGFTSKPSGPLGIHVVGYRAP